MAPIATIRYAKAGERLNAWRCFFSPNWTWRQRLSARGAATVVALLLPRRLWTWALRYRANAFAYAYASEFTIFSGVIG